MRGIIFTTFGEFVEQTYGYEQLDEIFTSGNYPNQGGFSPAQNYNPEALSQMIDFLAQQKEQSPEETWCEFGHFAFQFLIEHFSVIYSSRQHQIFAVNVFDFVKNLNQMHLDEVRKIYPKAKFPTFKIDIKGSEATLTYRSPARLHYLVQGLLLGCIDYFNEKIDMDMTLQHEGPDEYSEFFLRKSA